MGADPTITAVKIVMEIEDKVKALSAIVPGVMAVGMDLVTLLRTVVPQALMAQQAGLPMGAAPGVPMSPMLGGGGMAGGGMPGGGMPSPGGMPPADPLAGPAPIGAGGPPF